jgi:hypothetical protein
MANLKQINRGRFGPADNARFLPGLAPVSENSCLCAAPALPASVRRLDELELVIIAGAQARPRLQNEDAPRGDAMFEILDRRTTL